MHWSKHVVIIVAVFAAIIFVARAGPRFFDPTARDPAKQERDRRWIGTSPYLVDRLACTWLSLCGLHHLRADPANRDHPGSDTTTTTTSFAGELRSLPALSSAPQAAAAAGKPAVSSVVRDVPDYVLRHAPLVHLYSGEAFWPSDIRDHVAHMDVQLNQTVLDDPPPWDLDSMHDLDRLLAGSGGGRVFLHSKVDVERRPSWLHSRYNIPQPFPDAAAAEPDASAASPTTTGTPHHPHAKPPAAAAADGSNPNGGRVIDAHHGEQKQFLLAGLFRSKQQKQQQRRKDGKSGMARRRWGGHKPDSGGYSAAPAVLIVVDKGDGVVDAFWFFFYSYNLGQTVLTMRFGNHVADWEHCMVRFRHGAPEAVYLSEHEGGQAYTWEAMERRNVSSPSSSSSSSSVSSESGGGGGGVAERPVIYSALGSHAMYATPGDHPYILPFKLLKDVTDRGPLWDPSLHNYAYHYNSTDSDDDDDSDGEENLLSDGKRRRRSLITPASTNPSAPTSWFRFGGRWGDAVYPLADARQWRLFGQYHYVDGPQGPRFKKLGRRGMCLAGGKCLVRKERHGRGTWY